MTGPLGRLNLDSRCHPHAAIRLAVYAARCAVLRGGLALLLLAPWEVWLRAENAGVRRYLIDVWPGEKGLPQNTVTGIAQTSDGYLWLTTLDGVARFDGLRLKMFKASDTPALGSGRIRFMFTGRHGELWLSTQEGGVIRLLNGRFSPLVLPKSQGVRAAVTQVAEDESGALWLSTEDGKVGRLAAGQYSIVSTNWSAERGTGFQVRADARGRLWALSSSGLFQVLGDALVPAVQGKSGEYSFHSPSRTGGWWLVTGGRIRLWRDGQWLGAVDQPGGAAGGITCILEDHGGRLWVGTAANGLFRCDTNGATMQFTRQHGLSSVAIRTLLEDAEGHIWVGTEDGGLNRLRLPLFAVYGPDQGLSSERVTTVSEGPDGALWVGTDGNGVKRLGGEAAGPVGGDATSASWRVATVLADQAGGIWVGLRSGGVFRWQDGHFTPLTGFATAGYPTRSLYEDSRGAIWIGQRITRTLARVQGGKVQTVALPQSMPLADVRVAAEDASGAMWFGTDGAGLLRYKDGQFTRFTREQGLSSDFVWALRPEPDGSLWLGTYGGGLTRLKDGRAVTCTSRDGLVDDVICHIADDGRGQYWFSSNQGVFRVSKAELYQFAERRRARIHCVAYGKADGLPVLECEGGCQPAGCRSRDGRLWFPTIRGLVAVDPSDVSTNTVPPPVHIERLVVDGKEIGVSEWPQHDNGQARPVALELRPGSRRIEFHYTGVNFSAPEKLRFRHKLEGVDAEWVDTGGQREASYDRLGHGRYTFRVQACNREGVWNEAGDVVALTVLPYFWQTWWFAALFLTAFGGAVGVTVRHVLRRRHERQVKLLRQLHALERERTRIARDIHDDLGGSLTEIGYLGALAVRDSRSLEEAREQIGRITERTRELARRLDETVWAVNPKNDTPAQLATYLCRFAREFLEPTAIRCRLDVASSLPEVPLSAEVRHNVFLVVKEALNNAAKHSAAAELWLRLRTSDGALVIEVSDNGRGFRPEAHREAGNGLRNMTARMEEMGGRLTVRSAPGEGTTVCLQLPLADQRSGGNGIRALPIRMGDGSGARSA